MPGTPLTDFLIQLATNDELLQDFNSGTSRALSLMEAAGLGAEQCQAVLSRDPSAIHTELRKEGTTGQFVIPGGPIIPQPGRFEVTPIGIIIFGEGERLAVRPPRVKKAPKRPASKPASKPAAKPTKGAKRGKATKSRKSRGKR
jgi:hypothetical protein